MCKRDIGKIYQTTDGFFNNRTDIKKPRKVAVIHQRDDKAVAIVKIYKQEGKSGSAYINDLILTPKAHKSLDKPSIVGSKLIFSRITNKNKYTPIFTRDLNKTKDKLTKQELKHILKNVSNDTTKHRKTYLNTLKMWFNHNFQ